MFYFLSKLLAFLIQPAMWIIFLVLAAFLTKRPHRRKRLTGWALLLFVVFGNSAMYNMVMKTMESPRDKAQFTNQQFQYAVVLGGYGEYNDRIDDIEFHEASDRLTEALRLYNTGTIETIIVSSGVCGDNREKSEANISKDFLLDNGVPDAHVIAENNSWNTYQNAHYTALITDSLNLTGQGLLITSAFHMKRAQGCFNKAGLNLTSYPVDYFSNEGSYGFIDLLWPSMHTVIAWEVPIKEWIGYCVYKFKGYL